MQPSGTIVVVASDHGLSRSLAFALEVEGFQVHAFDSWKSYRDAALKPDCLIVDGEMLRNDILARQSLREAGTRIILLADEMSPATQYANAQILLKPLQGSDLMAIVNTLAEPIRSFP